MDLGLRTGWLMIRIPIPPDSGPTSEPEARDEAASPVSDPPVVVTGPHFGRLAGLDGLRAIAVLAVLLYHSGLGWLPGGFLGVELFFVISGYLITAMLLAEWQARGRIDLPAFWMRR